MSQNFPLDPNRLTSYNEAKNNKWPFYIAAELRPQQAVSDFIVGDGNWYGGYFNPPLTSNGLYTVIIGVVSRFNGVTKTSYSEPAFYQVRNKDSLESHVNGNKPSKEDLGYVKDLHETNDRKSGEHGK